MTPPLPPPSSPPSKDSSAPPLADQPSPTYVPPHATASTTEVAIQDTVMTEAASDQAGQGDIVMEQDGKSTSAPVAYAMLAHVVSPVRPDPPLHKRPREEEETPHLAAKSSQLREQASKPNENSRQSKKSRPSLPTVDLLSQRISGPPVSSAKTQEKKGSKSESAQDLLSRLSNTSDLPAKDAAKGETGQQTAQQQSEQKDLSKDNAKRELLPWPPSIPPKPSGASPILNGHAAATKSNSSASFSIAGRATDQAKEIMNIAGRAVPAPNISVKGSAQPISIKSRASHDIHADTSNQTSIKIINNTQRHDRTKASELLPASPPRAAPKLAASKTSSTTLFAAPKDFDDGTVVRKGRGFKKIEEGDDILTMPGGKAVPARIQHGLGVIRGFQPAGKDKSYRSRRRH